MTHIHASQSRVLRWAFSLGIIIVLNLLFGVGISLFYEAPQFDDFCGSKELVVEALDTQESCNEAGGQWIESTAVVDGRTVTPKLDTDADGYCDATFTCRQEYEDTRDVYNKTVFIALVVLGLVAIVVGVATKGWGVVANGLALGGVLSLVIASVRYWSSASDLIRFLILLVALGVLIWFGVKKFRE